MTIEESDFKLSGGVALTVIENIVIFFDYLSEESSTSEASITDNWVEENYTRQDHIAVKPRIYRLKGYVGEVIFKHPTKWRESISEWASTHPILKKTLKAIKPINAISGVISNYTQLAINAVDQLESSYNRYKQMYESFKNKNQGFVGKRQKTVNSILQNLLETKTPVKLTDLTFKDIDEIKGKEDRLYFLQSVSARQGENAFISDFEVTIKEFRIAKSKTTNADPNKYANYPSKTEVATNGTANTQQKTDEQKTLDILNDGVKKGLKLSEYGINFLGMPGTTPLVHLGRTVYSFLENR